MLDASRNVLKRIMTGRGGSPLFRPLETHIRYFHILSLLQEYVADICTLVVLWKRDELNVMDG